MDHQRDRWEQRYRERNGSPIRAPSRFLERCLASLPKGRALDIACGEGRNAILLARNGHRVDAIDFAYVGLRRGQALARAEGLPIRFVQADPALLCLPAERYSFVLQVRYLDRNLFPALKRALRPGGSIVIETFLADQVEQSRHPRNPAFLLREGELETAFCDFEIQCYEEGLCDSESGPAALARMLAKRPRREEA